MRHKKRGRKLGRVKSQRQALLRSLATDLVLKEAVTTTAAKCKSLRSYAERVVTVAKSKPARQAKQLLARKLYSGSAVRKVLKDLKERYQTRSGGYTRILNLGQRFGDQAPMAKIEWV
jgi:large subunit ribosomal protein L17